jgi:hypothetical protein
MKSAPRTPHYTVAMPTHCDDEYLPSGWHDIGLAAGIGDEQLYKSWARFKQVSRFPWALERWKKWVANERLPDNQRRRG